MAQAKTGSKEKKSKQELKAWEGHCGTRDNMVVHKLEDPIYVNTEVKNVNTVAQDENGYYFTNCNWVGNKLMDPHRRLRSCRLTESQIEEYEL
jgi:hypothetical protein